MRSYEHYYKSSDIEYEKELDRKKFEYFNEYGFNFDSNTRKCVDKERFNEKLINNYKENGINIRK